MMIIVSLMLSLSPVKNDAKSAQFEAPFTYRVKSPEIHKVAWRGFKADEGNDGSMPLIDCRKGGL